MKIHRIISKVELRGKLERLQVTFLFDLQHGAEHKAITRHSGTLHLRRTTEWNVKEDREEVLYKGHDPFAVKKTPGDIHWVVFF